MSDSGEETYSIMFASLKHPARRKILRMLAKEPQNFSRILEELGISSSHLTYHLDNLDELVTKMEDGKYKLSSFGKAAVLTMKGVEEAPEVKSTKLVNLSIRWKLLFSIFMIILILLTTFSYNQHLFLSNISSENQRLIEEFEELEKRNEHLLSWGTPTDKVVNFLENVIQLDLTKYTAKLERNSVGYRLDLGGIIEEFFTYRLISDESELLIDFRFRNQTLSRYLLDVIEGSPIFVEPQSNRIIDLTDELLERYQNYVNHQYLDNMRNMLDEVNTFEEIEIVSNDIKLKVSIEGKDVEIRWLNTVEEIDYQAKSLIFNFDNGLLEAITDGWFLFNIGSTEINVSREQAIELAIGHAMEYSWTFEGDKISDFVILQQPLSIDLWPHVREPLDLVPYWYIVLRLDKVYSGNVNGIGVGVWADTGQINALQTLSLE